MRQLSVIITTFNEASNIEVCLESVKWADEIMIVDSYSTDETVAISQQYTSNILQRKYTGPADQKNWAIPQATHDWVLILDADEQVTPKLKNEIQTILQSNPSKDAYWIPRQSFFMGKKIRYSGWQGDAVIRLLQKNKCRYNQQQVHEEIITEGINVGHLKNKLNPFTYKNLNHYLAKVERYAEWSAKDHLKKTKKITLYHLWIKPLFRFIKHYFFQLGFLDGKVGFIISAIMAWSVFLRYSKMVDLKK